MAEHKDALRVFISYARRDASKFAEELLCGLEVAGFEAFLDRHDIEAGVDWEARLGGLIESADTVVFVISPAAVGSERCGWEVRRAEQLSKRVIPVVLVDVPEQQTPHGLKRLNYIFFTEGNSYSLKLGELAKALRVDFDWIREHTRLGDAARRWQGRDKNAVLLLRGGELDAARAWLAGWKAPAPEPTDLHRAFINASETAENAALKDERARLKKQARVQRIAWYATGAALAVTLIGAALVINSRRDLNEQTSLVLADAGYDQYENGDFARGLRFSLLAAKGGSIFSPIAIQAEDALAANASGVHPLAEMRGHAAAILEAVVSKDGRVLTTSEDGTARLWDSEGAGLAVLRHQEEEIEGARFFEDGRVLTWGEDGAARIWSAEGGELKVLQHGEGSLGVSVSEDELRILTRDGEGRVRLWDASGTPLAALEGTHISAGFVGGGRFLTSARNGDLQVWDGARGAPIASVENAGRNIGVSSDGSVAVVSNGARIGVVDLATGALTELTFPDAQGPRMAAIRLPRAIAMHFLRALFGANDARFFVRWAGGADILWDATNGRPIKVFEGRFRGMSFSEDRRHILVWSGDDARVLDAGTGEQVGAELKDVGRVSTAAFYADNRRVLLWGNGRVRLLVVATGDELVSFDVGSNVAPPILFADESRILTWSREGEMRVWDAVTGTQIGPALQHGVELRGARVNAEGTRILTWSEDGVARFWSTAFSAQIGPTIADEGALFLADGARILSWGVDGAHLFRADTGAQIALIKHEEDAEVAGAIVSLNQRRVLTWGGRTARLWDARGAPIGAVLEHEHGVNGALFSANESRILTWSADGRAQLWDAANQARIGAPMLHDDMTGALLQPREGRVLTWSEDGTTRLWNPANGRRVELPHESEIAEALFSTDGSRLLTRSADGSARLWNAANGALIGALRHEQHSEDGVRGVLFADDGRVLSWGEDGTLRWWDGARGVQIGAAIEHDGPVEGALLSNDGRRILSWDTEEAQLWDAETGAQIKPAMPHDAINGARFSADDSRILTWGSDGFARIWNANSGVEVGPVMRAYADGALFSPNGSRALLWGSGEVSLWNVRWTRRQPDIAALRREVCDDDAIPASIRRIDARDIEIAPVLRVREGHDVCD